MLIGKIDDHKKEIIDRFDKSVRGKKPDTTTATKGHDGKEGHWLEKQMGIAANADNKPDIFGYEMKNQTTSKTTFGDWSANYYIFKDKSNKIDRDDFLTIFGKSNAAKNGRFSWSGEPSPKINKINSFGQILIVGDKNDIYAMYHFSSDTRVNKAQIIPIELQKENLILAKWDRDSIKEKLEKKFNQKGWFKCLKNDQGYYDSIVFGNPITFENWINMVKTGDVFFDSGMYQTNPRNYSQWRANNSLWDSLIISKY